MEEHFKRFIVTIKNTGNNLSEIDNFTKFFREKPCVLNPNGDVWVYIKGLDYVLSIQKGARIAWDGYSFFQITDKELQFQKWTLEN